MRSLPPFGITQSSQAHRFSEAALEAMASTASITSAPAAAAASINAVQVFSAKDFNAWIQRLYLPCLRSSNR